MEILFVLGGVWMFLRFLNWLNGGAPPSLPSNNEVDRPLEIRAVKSWHEEVKCDVIEIQLRGHLSNPAEGPVTFNIRLNTGKDNEPVISRIAAHTDGESPFFNYTTDPFTPPFADTVWKDWWTIVAVQVEALVPARGGNQLLNVGLLALSRSSNDPLDFVETTTHLRLDTTGWREKGENEKKLQELTIEIAMALSAIDGTIDKREKSIIQAFCKREIASYPTEFQAGHKERLNQVLKSSLQRTKSGSGQESLTQLLDKIVSIADHGECLAILELCMDIVGADGKVDASETTFLAELRDHLKISAEEYRSVFGQRIGANTDQDAESLRSMLGIEASMPNEAVRKIIMEESRVWLGLLGSSDAEKRAKAEQRVAMLAKLKKDLGV